ncbi:hypothetical protein N836_07960 [Leptolyngbya sp. Heron Island J]|uniref:hypothetical protein n=1 Tax=Leptolyngbya sp. Heron Island J TaxID=1385935 RepID=UPI0003B96638|nr:hypothetical protein [Leptolyngbya sp. Heron Island J]ESA36267.1 hypothetical protein N836_07960 [Leptolyngbya sp. Heron Island J]
MDIQERITRQRVKHIVESYRLDGSDVDAFADNLTKLLEIYPQSLVEIALVESIVKGWSEVPMQRGMPFIQGVQERLRAWQPELWPSSQLSSTCKSAPTSTLGGTSIEVRVADPNPINPDSINVTLTPGQFEQITGLDASLVFDDQGRILLRRSVGMIDPLEQC